MKHMKLLLMWGIFIVTGGYHIRCHGCIGIRKDRYFTERVHAESKAHAANQVICYYRTEGRNHVYVDKVVRVK